jgi:hypothetical protein
VVDEEGYSIFQLWSLIDYFGDMMDINGLPFETDIKIEFD